VKLEDLLLRAINEKEPDKLIILLAATSVYASGISNIPVDVLANVISEIQPRIDTLLKYEFDDDFYQRI
jgi:hypothetical protein